MKTLCLLLAVLLADSGFSFQEAVLFLSGASTLEELDESEWERFRSLAAHPVDLNRASRSRLLATGLLSPYQVASLLAYRGQGGDVLSYRELALVDGFSAKWAEALRPFTVLGEARVPGRRPRERLRYEQLLRTAVKGSGQGTPAVTGGVRTTLRWGERAVFNWASRTTYAEPRFGPGTLSAAYYGSRFPGQLVLGHLRIRFGQGLIQWSGFRLSGYPSLTAFRRNGTGLGAATSFSADLLGVGADCNLGRWTGTLAWAWPDRVFGSLAYTGHRWHAALNATDEAVSVDGTWGIGDCVLFGEAAWKGAPAAVAGLLWQPAYDRRYALTAKYDAGSLEAAAGAKAGLFEGTASYVRKAGRTAGQTRAILSFRPSLSLGPVTLAPSCRISSRYEASSGNPWRNDLRLDMAASFREWSFQARFNALWSKESAWLCYAEAGYGGVWKLYARWTLFKVDHWADRIYVYERDAPGNFNVPAYYGRGYALSLVAAWKKGRHSCWLRADSVRYPWMAQPKEGRWEVKLQYRFSL